MPVSTCRVCSHGFFGAPLLRYENMPGAAQFFPDALSLKSDKGVNVEVYQCSGCGLVQLSNDPVPYFKEVVRAAAVSEEMKDFRMKQFGRFIQKFSLNGKKVVEIGCGRGEYLSLLRQCGVETYGLEHAASSVKQCVKNGLRVSQGFIDSPTCTLPHAPFDAFLILNFLEHLPDPNSTLSGIRANLADGAVGLVEVPNFDMILRKNLFSEFIPDHLFYFTSATLRTVLSLNGFDVIDCKEVWHDYIISALVCKRQRLDMSHFHEHQKQLKTEIEKFIRRFPDRKVAVWGAGHQALAVIALMGLSDKIRYVVDSAVFKQGKYTPATHVPTVSPDALNSDPVDAVIVMAASYSDEVAAIIRQKFGKSMAVAILRDFGLEIA